MRPRRRPQWWEVVHFVIPGDALPVVRRAQPPGNATLLSPHPARFVRVCNFTCMRQLIEWNASLGFTILYIFESLPHLLVIASDKCRAETRSELKWKRPNRIGGIQHVINYYYYNICAKKCLLERFTLRFWEDMNLSDCGSDRLSATYSSWSPKRISIDHGGPRLSIERHQTGSPFVQLRFLDQLPKFLLSK